MGKVTRTGQRKSEHIRINLEQDVQSGLTTGLEAFHFEHNALPEISLAQIDTRITFLGKQLRLPLLISSMTGGTSEVHRYRDGRWLTASSARGSQFSWLLCGERTRTRYPTLR